MTKYLILLLTLCSYLEAQGQIKPKIRIQNDANVYPLPPVMEGPDGPSGTDLTPWDNPLISAQWHFAGNNNKIHNASGTYKPSNDWVYSIVSTERKEYVACGYTIAEDYDQSVSGVIFKLDHNGNLVWSRNTRSVNFGSTVLPVGKTVLWNVTKAVDGYAAVGYYQGATTSYILITEVNEDGVFINNTPRAIEVPATMPDLMSAFLSSTSINWSTTTRTFLRGSSVAIDPTTNSVNNLVIGGYIHLSDPSSTSPPLYRMACVITLNCSAGSWSIGKRYFGGNNFGPTSVCGGTIDNGGNRIMKLLTKVKPGGGYDIFGCGAISGPHDNAIHCCTNLASEYTNVQTRDKDMWFFSIPSDFSAENFSRAFNKTNIRLDGDGGSSYTIDAINSTTYPSPYSQGHSDLTARYYNPSTGYLKNWYLGSYLESPCSIYFNSMNNENEEAHDMTFTADGNIAIVGGVNLIGANVGNNGNNGNNVIISVGSGMATGWGKEYEDMDGFLLKCDLNGTLLAAKGVSHFSGQLFQMGVREDPLGNFIVTGSSADKLSIPPMYNTPDPVAHSANALIAIVPPNFTPGLNDVQVRAYVNKDSRATDINPGNDSSNNEEDFCVFGMDATADGGFVICGNNRLNNDDFTITKFSPFYQTSLLNGAFCKFGATYAPAVYTLSSNETWPNSDVPTNSLIATKVVVPAGKKLTISNCNLNFASTDHLWDYWSAADAYTTDGIGCGIIVEPGGELEISGSNIAGISTTGEHNVWDGVVVKGNPASSLASNQGRATISNSTIEDARCAFFVAENYRTYTKKPATYAITTGVTYSSGYDGYSTKGGGIISADHVTFRNCAYGVTFENYPFNNRSAFTNCEFTSDNTGVGDICHYTDGLGRLLPPNTHLSAWGMRGIRVSQSDFTCDKSFPCDIRSIGVLSTASNLRITEHCNVPSAVGGCLSGYYSGNTFSNLSYGVVAGNPAVTSPAITISKNSFDNCGKGVSAASVSYGLVIRDNEFKVPGPLATSTNPLGYWKPAGIVVAGCKAYDVSNNSFDKCSTCSSLFTWLNNAGIIINNGHGNDEKVQKNTFDYITTAMVGSQKNANATLGTGLQFSCNNFRHNLISITRSSTFADNTLLYPAQIRNQQGNCSGTSTPAGNQFNNGCGADFRLRSEDVLVTQNVTYNNNLSGSFYDPGPCINSSIYTNHDCAISGALPDVTAACPNPVGYDDNTTSTVLETLDGIGIAIGNSSDPDVIAELNTDRESAIGSIVRYYSMNEEYDDAAALLASYGKYRDALPFYLMAGDYQNAQTMYNSMPIDSTEDSLFAWQAQLAINLYSQGQTWFDLDSASRDSLQKITQYNMSSGYMAGAVNMLIGIGTVTWPEPFMDTAWQDSVIADSAQFRMTTHDGRQPAPAISDISKSETQLFQIYPNPTNGSFVINTSSPGKFELSTLLAQRVTEFTVTKGETTLRIPENLAAGVYIGIFRYSDGEPPKEVKFVYQPE